MAYVVTEPCFGCKYTDCVVVCPCDCFHEGEQMLFIDPDQCIDCDACRRRVPRRGDLPRRRRAGGLERVRRVESGDGRDLSADHRSQGAARGPRRGNVTAARGGPSRLS